MKKIEFVLYKGDKVIDYGTKEELAIRHNCKPNNIEYLSYPASIKRDKEGNRKVSVKVAIDELGESSMDGEIISIDTLNKKSDTEKKIERLNRDNNLLELKNNNLESQLSKYKKRNNELEKSEKILNLVVKNLEENITKLLENKKQEVSITAIQELLKTIKKSYKYEEGNEENEKE